MRINIQSILALFIGLSLLGCQELIETPGPEGNTAPGGEIAFCIGTEDLNGEPLTKGMVTGEDYTTVASLQLVCFDQSGYFLGLRTAHPNPDSGEPKYGTFSGYVPESTARIHFVANASLDLSSIAVGTSEKVIMTSEALSTKYNDIDPSDTSAPKLCFWGYHKEDNAGAMKTWLQEGLPAKGSGTPNTVKLLRDRARIQLKVSSTLYDGSSWTDDSAGTGKRITSINWGINNGRERGYLAPPATSWVGYDSGVTMNEYEDCDRYVLPNKDALDIFVPTVTSNYQYVFDDSNMKTTSHNGRIAILMEVNYENNGGGGAGTKYLLAQLRIGSGADLGEMVQVTRNNTYVVNITNLSHSGYTSFADAANINADDFTNAPADVDISVPYITDGTHILNLLSPKPVVVTRTAGQTYTVEFEYKRASSTESVAPSDFTIYWEDNINDLWTSSSGGTVGTDLSVVATAIDNVYKGTFTVKIGTIGTSYAFSDYLIIRHKQSGLSRYIHFYAVEQFRYREEPVLEQVMIGDTSAPYMGPSADDTERPVFRLRFKLSQSLQEDLFPITVRLTSSTLEPYGDKSTSATARLSGGFAVLNTSTETAAGSVPLPIYYYSDGEPNTSKPIPTGNAANDWNYKYTSWDYWYGYTLNEYPKTGENRDGEVIIYLKDIRDAYAQASEQAVGLYLDIEDFAPRGLTSTIVYPNFPYPAEEGRVAGTYTVGSVANKYRVTITGADKGATYTISEEHIIENEVDYGVDWITENPTTVTADASGNLIIKFSVTKNESGVRKANIVCTKSGESDKTVKLTVIQEAGMDPDFRLKADNESVLGNTQEVNLTVYSDENWTLETSNPGSLSIGGGTPGTSINGPSTGPNGMRVQLTMPVNYTTSDIVYTLTLTKTDSPSVSTSVNITQRKTTLKPDQSVKFTARNHFTSGPTQTLSGIIGTFPSQPATAGGWIADPTLRWDFTSDAVLTLTKEDSVKEMTGFLFEFHETGLSGIWCPDYINVDDNTTTKSPDYGPLAPETAAYRWNWNPAPVPFTDVTITFARVSNNIGLVSFTVYYTIYTWE